MATNDAELDRVRWELRAAVNRVPARLNGAYIHEVRNWKDACARAMKVLGKRNATLQELQGALSSIQ